VQHYWSLSVEEQFYIGWPILIAVVHLATRRLRTGAVTGVRIALAAVVAASFGWSVWLTWADPARAYFVTPTRVWELGVGALLAAFVVPRVGSFPRDDHRGVPRATLRWAGFAGIAWSAWTYTSATPFPGWHAALPVLATAAVIAAGDPRTGVEARLLGVRPVQRLGDLSYSVYLWHWPAIVLLPALSGGEVGLPGQTAVAVLSIVLAELTKRFVEDRFRSGRSTGLIRPFVAAAAGSTETVKPALTVGTSSPFAKRAAASQKFLRTRSATA
jgi:peptidoglycan/LPS O-acetylase OafA/YrhL